MKPKMLAQRLLQLDDGATSIEYAFVASLISLMVIAGATQLSGMIIGFLAIIAKSL